MGEDWAAFSAHTLITLTISGEKAITISGYVPGKLPDRTSAVSAV